MGTLAQLDTTAIGIPPGSCHQTWNPNPMSPILAHVGMYSLTAATVAPCWCGGLKITHSRVWPPAAGRQSLYTLILFTARLVLATGSDGSNRNTSHEILCRLGRQFRNAYVLFAGKFGIDFAGYLV